MSQAETILERALGRVANHYDKRQGSLLYTACAPTSIELSLAYTRITRALANAFMETADSEHQDLIAKEHGLLRHPAQAAIRKGVFTDKQGNPADVAIGDRFAAEGLAYVVIGKLTAGEYLLQAEQAGTVGNTYSGDLLPLSPNFALGTAQLTDILQYGTDAESDEHFKASYLSFIQRPITSGNKYHYEQWALAVAGVGKALCQPLHEGPGTVKVLITDAAMQPATDPLIEEVAAYIENERPIGAIVTVAAPKAVRIDIGATVTLSSAVALETVRNAFQAAARQFLSDNVFQKPYVSSAQVGSLLLDTPGVLDYMGLTLNDGAGNVPVATGSIPILGTVTLEV